MDATEARTQEIGRQLLRQVRQDAEMDDPIAALSDRWMAPLMRDAALKTAMFRLVDVLPVLRTPRQINRHLKEYLGHFRSAGLLRLLPEQGIIAQAGSALATAAVGRLARRFIVAGSIDEAPAAVCALRRKNLAFTIDLLGEAVLSETEADHYAQQYHTLIDRLADRLGQVEPVAAIDQSPAGAIPRVNVSIKLSSLFSQFDPLDPAGTFAAVSGRLRPILHHARQRGAFVCFDMEQFALKDATLGIFKQILLEHDLRDWPDVGIAVQAYLINCGDDLENLADWSHLRGTPVWVRVVKGAYWDFELVTSAQNNWPRPVFAEKHQTDASFERQTRFLIEHRDLLRPAVASHNLRSIAHALALVERYRLAPRTIEFQMLHGMAAPIQNALVDLGQRVRLYAPVGSLLPGMAYLVRRLLENTSNESFLRAAMGHHASEEELFMNPERIASNPPKIPTDEFQNEPPTDFSRAEARQSMQEALARKFKHHHPLVIGGREIATEQWIESINPSHTKQTNGRCAQATTAHPCQAVAAARDAFDGWRDRSFADRADLLLRVADHLRRRRFELAALEVAECGKPWREADADVAEAIDFCVYYARQAIRLGTPRQADVAGETNAHFYEPRGVAAVIAPWNFPLAILCGMTSAAVVTGNTVIMKPAEQSSLIAAELMNAFTQSAAPPGVVNYLPGIGEEIGPSLLACPDIDLIAFTGSRQVGLAIQQSAAQTPPGQDHVKRVIAEMGGKNAIIVDADADLDDAIRGIVASAFGYAGQKCSACSRLILLEEIHDALLGRLIEAVKSIRVAPAEDPSCFVGPVINAEAFDRIGQAIERGKSESKLLYAADVGDLADEGFFIGPHVFGDVPPQSTLAQEEIFGPVLAVLRAKDLDHALAMANGVPYALTGGFYSRSPANIDMVRRRFRVGDLYINRKITGALVGRQPFGGFKLSGIGSQAGGPDYLLQFLIPRVVTENTLRHGFAPTPNE
jgi:RHH-type transcriptional regulator, proline utilization regulon repressor / proline dehydrogenase / delta 1-pyrroline-5-carboxylate dehydrogenase